MNEKQIPGTELTEGVGICHEHDAKDMSAQPRSIRKICSKCGTIFTTQEKRPNVPLAIIGGIMVVSGIFIFTTSILVFLGGLVVCALAGITHLSDPECPRCHNQEAIIDFDSPMGQKIFSETKDRRMSSGKPRINEQNDMTQQAPSKMSEIIRSPVDMDETEGWSNDPTVKFCTECGAARGEGAKFCGRCGRKF